jgi:hypothetical protein
MEHLILYGCGVKRRPGESALRRSLRYSTSYHFLVQTLRRAQKEGATERNECELRLDPTAASTNRENAITERTTTTGSTRLSRTARMVTPISRCKGS